MEIEPFSGPFLAVAARGAGPFARPRGGAGGRPAVRFLRGRESLRGRPGPGLPAAALAP